MSSETRFSIYVKGCAATAYKINESRDCVMDLTSVLLETQDNVRQIHMLNRVLGIRAMVPAPPAGPAPVTPRPHVALRDSQHNSNESSRLADTEGMYRMEAVVSPGSSRRNGDSVTTAPLHFSATTSSRTFTPVSTMQRLAHAVPEDAPMDVIAASALDFVAAWRREDSRCSAQEDLIHDCLSTRRTIETAEEEGRWRLQHLLVTVTEQLSRFVILGEYDKFAVFCVENEPVWRQAARQLQRENDARLNTTENIYARFLLEDTAVAEKTRSFQEAADYVVSLSLAEREQRAVAKMKAMTRRRRQSASQVVTPTSTPREPRSAHRDHDTASAPLPTPQRPAPASSDPLPATGRGFSMAAAAVAAAEATSGNAAATRRVKPMTAVEVDNYREGWRAMMGHLTNGERGRTGHHTDTTATGGGAAAAAAPLPAHSGSGNDKHKMKSPVQDTNAHQSKKDSKAFVFPSPKEERRVEVKRSSRDERENKMAPLPQLTSRDAKRSQKEDHKSGASPPPPPRSRDEPREHHHGSRDGAERQSGRSADEAAARKAKDGGRAKESRNVSVNAASVKHSDDKRDARDGKHNHRH